METRLRSGIRPAFRAIVAVGYWCPGVRPALAIGFGTMSPSPLKPVLKQARAFAAQFESTPHPKLFGVTDGKAVGTYIELAFKKSLQGIGLIEATEGNAGKGIDLPSLNTDIKVTSIEKPQSSSPFASFKQKIEGLGYNLIVFIYRKQDGEDTSQVTFEGVRFVPAGLTADFQTTRSLRKLILEDEGNTDDVFAVLVDNKIPADEDSLYKYAQSLVDNPPAQGYLTISNALQWRLNYGRIAAGGIPGIEDIG